jgi:hypothetical protein
VYIIVSVVSPESFPDFQFFVESREPPASSEAWNARSENCTKFVWQLRRKHHRKSFFASTTQDTPLSVLLMQPRDLKLSARCRPRSAGCCR